MAHGLLRRGDNMYYLANNGMVAAREARIAGRPLAALGWLARTAVGIVRAAVDDRLNFMPAVRTAVRRLPDTLTPNRALGSLLVPNKR